MVIFSRFNRLSFPIYTQHGNDVVSQMMVLMVYLGEKLGYSPSETQNIAALQFAANLSDVVMEAFFY